MKKVHALLAFAMTLCLLAVTTTLFAGAPGGQPAQRAFRALLTGAEEVPPVETDGSGVFVARTNADETELHYILVATGLENIRFSHIHIAPLGVNGPVTTFLFHPMEPVTVNGLLARGTITSDDLIGPLAGMTIADLLDEMRSGNAYVNVHTDDHPSGEIRGQIQ